RDVTAAWVRVAASPTFPALLGQAPGLDESRAVDGEGHRFRPVRDVKGPELRFVTRLVRGGEGFRAGVERAVAVGVGPGATLGVEADGEGRQPLRLPVSGGNGCSGIDDR